MPNKNAILMNLETISSRATQINIGTWSDEKQKKFIETIRQLENETCGTFSCRFDVFYGHETAFEVNPWRKKTTVEYKPHDAVNPAKTDEIVIVIRPGLLKNTDCIVSRVHDCPICIANGQCHAPFIRRYIGKMLFPNNYLKQL